MFGALGINGNFTPAKCAIIDELCPLHGKPHRPQFEIEMAADNELKCLLPLLPLMERFVGEVDNIYYFGYIMSI